jgi:uncharacterized membrane protein YidH (DUF202 family)
MKDEQQIRADAAQDADPRIHLAVERTVYALERTQLAWIRTIMGLITAGIAIDRGFAALHEARLVTGEAWVKNGHLGGLVLTISGTLLIVMVTIFYVKRTGELNLVRGKKRTLAVPGLFLSLLVFVVGFLAIFFMSIG